MAKKALAIVLLITGGLLGLVLTYGAILVFITATGDSVSYESVLPHMLIGFAVGQLAAIVFAVLTFRKS